MAVTKIELTGRRPVSVESDEWTDVATVGDKWHDGKVYAQSNWEAQCNLSVWTNADPKDDRAIVFGSYDYSSSSEGARGIRVRSGYLLGSSAEWDVIVSAIEQVGRDLKNAAGPEPRIDIDALVREAIAALPAEEI